MKNILLTILLVFGATQSYSALTRVPGRMMDHPGIILAYGDDVQPDFCLFAYGQTVSQTTYSRLYALYGTLYNTGGEVAGTFRLPDLRGRGLFGDDNMGGVTASRITNAVSGITGTTLGAVGGSQLLHQHTHVQNSHTHTGTTDSVTYYHLFVDSNTDVTKVLAIAQAFEGDESHSHTFTTGSTTPTNQDTGTGASQNIPPAMIVNWCITI